MISSRLPRMGRGNSRTFLRRVTALCFSKGKRGSSMPLRRKIRPRRSGALGVLLRMQHCMRRSSPLWFRFLGHAFAWFWLRLPGLLDISRVIVSFFRPGFVRAFRCFHRVEQCRYFSHCVAAFDERSDSGFVFLFHLFVPSAAPRNQLFSSWIASGSQSLALPTARLIFTISVSASALFFMALDSFLSPFFCLA